MNMKFEPIFFNEQIIGHALQNSKQIVFFGNNNSNLTNIQGAFRSLKFSRLKQVHGDLCIETQDSAVADAHWTTENQLGLLIATADCIPIIITSNTFCCAIHAGWRGIMNELVIKSFAVLHEQNLLRSILSSSPLTVYSGPHILFQSFEVEKTLSEDFIKFSQRYSATPTGSRFVSQPSTIQRAHPSQPNKAFINLKEILRAQLESCQLPTTNIFDFTIDTFTDANYHSFRRDRDKSGRNLSFVARLCP